MVAQLMRLERITAAGIAAGLAIAVIILSPAPASAMCGEPFTSPAQIAHLVRSDPYTLAFEGVVRERWFTTSLVEVQRSWHGHPPSRFVVMSPCQGPECQTREMIVGRSYLFFASVFAGPAYQIGCGDPMDANAAAVADLGPAENAPGLGPADLVALVDFVVWSAWVFLAAGLLIGGAVVVARLSHKWAT